MAKAKPRQNTKAKLLKVSPFKGKQGRGYRFEQLRGYMQRRRRAKYSEIREVSPLLKKGNRKGVRGAHFELLGRDTCSSEDSSVDRISMLPDELLGLILSHITFKEQVATSILCRQWRYLWTLTTTRLDFDGIDSILRISRDPSLRHDASKLKEKREKERLNYVSWVNHILESRKRFMLEDFKVHFILSKNEAGCIDEWLKYALACKVETLELNLTNHVTARKDDEYYVFPCKFLQEKENSPNLLHFKQLKRILLNFVDVDSKALEFLLHNCPLLEDLSVSNTVKLEILRVTGPFPALKRLEICWCRKLRSLEICDVVNLVYLKYYGFHIHHMRLQNLPMLVNLCVDSCHLRLMNDTVAQFSSILVQLEMYHLNVQDLAFRFPVRMSNLKQLVVTYVPDRHDSFLPITLMIHSAPCLQKLVLKSRRYGEKIRDGKFRRRKIKKERYSQLKEVEFIGFRGMLSDLEFVFHFVDNARALNRIVIDPKYYGSTPYYHKNREQVYTKDETIALVRAEKQLATEVPWNIKVDFLSRF